MGWGLRPMSKKREAEILARRAVVQKVKWRDRGCRAKDVVTEVRCSGPMDVHEIIPRSVWRAGYLDPDNCLYICRAHHDWVGDHPDEAHGYGLHGYSWETPKEKR